MATVLIIDDEAIIGKFLKAAAERLGFEARAVTALDEFWPLYETLVPTVIILDLMMPDVDGIELLRQLAERKTQAGIIVMSGVDKRTLVSAQRLGQSQGLAMVGNLQKPMRLEEVQALLTKASAPLAST